MLDEIFAERPLEKWIEPMNAERLIWAPVRTLAEAIADENAEQAGSFPTVDHPEYGAFKTVAPPLQMSGHEITGANPAPEWPRIRRPFSPRPGSTTRRLRCWSPSPTDPIVPTVPIVPVSFARRRIRSWPNRRRP